MEIRYSNEPLKVLKNYSIFLAGPSLRSPGLTSWRKKALEILKELNYKGIVCIPENDSDDFDYLNQVEWEMFYLNNVDKIAFWIPRDLKNLPGFTTNVEFGRYVDSNRIIYGRPDNSEKNRYLDWLYEKMGHGKPFNNLKELLIEAIK